MDKCIEIHSLGGKAEDGTTILRRHLINIKYIKMIDELRTICKIHTADGETLIPVENYEEIRMMIGSAQGGIPANWRRKNGEK